MWGDKSFIFKDANYLLIPHVWLQFVFLAMLKSSNHILSMLMGKFYSFNSMTLLHQLSKSSSSLASYVSSVACVSCLLMQFLNIFVLYFQTFLVAHLSVLVNMSLNTMTVKEYFIKNVNTLFQTQVYFIST